MSECGANLPCQQCSHEFLIGRLTTNCTSDDVLTNVSKPNTKTITTTTTTKRWLNSGQPRKGDDDDDYDDGRLDLLMMRN